MERFGNNLNHKLSRREFFKISATVGTVAVVFAEIKALQNLAEQKEFRDPYDGIHLDEYLHGFVVVDLKKVNIRTAPKLDQSFLRTNNQEAFVKGEIPPEFTEVKAVNDKFSGRKAILGDLVEVNGVSVVEDRYDLLTNRKSILVSPIIIQNPGIVKGDDPDNPSSQEGRWIVLNSSIRIPDEEQTDYPFKVYYTVVTKTFYVSLGA
jgi:hypothetical protein